MTSLEQKKTFAKLVLVASVALIILLILIQFFPDIFSQSASGNSSSDLNLNTVYQQLDEKYKENTAMINTANENAENLNISANELKSYSDKNISKYAIGGGISMILGLWLSTIIFYIKESKDLFRK